MPLVDAEIISGAPGRPMARSRKYRAVPQSPLGAKKKVDRVALNVIDLVQVPTTQYGTNIYPHISLKPTHTVVGTHQQCDKLPDSPCVNEWTIAIWR